MRHKVESAFTLLELAIVIGIVAVLTMLLLPLQGKARIAAQRAVCVGQLRQIYAGFVAYTIDHYGHLPRGGTGAADDAGFDTWRGAWLKPNSQVGGALRDYVGGEDALLRLVVCPANKDPKPSAGAYSPYGYPYVCNYQMMTQNGLATKPANLGRIETSKVFILADSSVGSNWGLGFTKTSGWERIAERHDGTLNLLWADGHMSAVRKADITVDHVTPVAR